MWTGTGHGSCCPEVNTRKVGEISDEFNVWTYSIRMFLILCSDSKTTWRKNTKVFSNSAASIKFFYFKMCIKYLTETWLMSCESPTDRVNPGQTAVTNFPLHFKHLFCFFHFLAGYFESNIIRNVYWEYYYSEVKFYRICPRKDSLLGVSANS